jgi:signal transduction histidine kinase
VTAPATAVALGAAVLVAFFVGLAVGLGRGRARLRRVTDAIAELARGNLAHRVILAGDDPAARMGESLNALADDVQAEREATAAREGSRRRLLANISHDLRTPITSIAGYADALQRGLGDEPERYLAIIGAKTEELAQLTDDLFYAARLDAGDLELVCVPLDLAEAVRRSVLSFEPLLAGQGVRVDADIPDRRCLVEADASAVARILSNLVANSLRHADGMRTFSVAMHPDGTDYVVRVANDGSRLPVDAERLFQRGVAGSGGGAGLGLSIARELAGHMGAALTGENLPRAGVTFTLTFPRLPELDATG